MNSTAFSPLLSTPTGPTCPAHTLSGFLPTCGRLWNQSDALGGAGPPWAGRQWHCVL